MIKYSPEIMIIFPGVRTSISRAGKAKHEKKARLDQDV